eukprot:NODE_221_length_12388_cov_2.350883.p6 type:complete len:258 gc:universal NODE_221_length_12388_cov_2.350883:8456-7683(-)
MEMPYPPVPDAIPTSVELEMKGYSTDPQSERNENILLTLNMLISDFEEDDNIFELKGKADKLSLKLIQNACKADNFKKVLALSGRLHLEQSYEAAAKIVNYFNRSDIADLILSYKNENEFDEDDDVQASKIKDPFAADDYAFNTILTNNDTNNYSFEPMERKIENELVSIAEVSSLMQIDNSDEIKLNKINPFALDKPEDVQDESFSQSMEKVKKFEELKEDHRKRMTEEEENRKRVKLYDTQPEEKENAIQTQLKF